MLLLLLRSSRTTAYTLKSPRTYTGICFGMHTHICTHTFTHTRSHMQAHNRLSRLCLSALARARASFAHVRSFVRSACVHACVRSCVCMFVCCVRCRAHARSRARALCVCVCNNVLGFQRRIWLLRNLVDGQNPNGELCARSPLRVCALCSDFSAGRVCVLR